jgi:hypothetical protein
MFLNIIADQDYHPSLWIRQITSLIHDAIIIFKVETSGFSIPADVQNCTDTNYRC